MSKFFSRFKGKNKQKKHRNAPATDDVKPQFASGSEPDPPSGAQALKPSLDEHAPVKKQFSFMREGNLTRSTQPDKAEPPTAAKPVHHSRLPGSDGEHHLQERYATEDRALVFYDRQVLDYLAPAMREFISRQEFLFVATADRHGECDCTSKFGEPGFIRVLSDKHLIYPEYRGNGVYANAGNIIENPHIALLILDFYKDAVGLHVNGKARIVENEELFTLSDKLPENVIEELQREGKRCPERWVMVEVEEAYIQCSKHIPLLKKLDRKIDWGTDSVVLKKGDYFQLQDIPLYNRIGGDEAMEIAVDIFYRKVLQDDLVGSFFEDVDMDGQRLKQKSFLAMAFGGPYQYSGLDLRAAHAPLIQRLGLTDAHFDRVLAIFRETLEELRISSKDADEMMAILESARDDVLNR